MSASIYHRMATLRASGQRFAVATVVRTHGSTPQVVGATLVLGEDDDVRAAVGTLGGGCVEADAVDAARDVISSGTHSLRAYELTEELAWNTGLVCGGTMWILVQRDDEALTFDGVDVLPALVSAADGGAPVAVVTHLHRTSSGLARVGRLVVHADGTHHGVLASDRWSVAARTAALAQLPHGTARTVKLEDDHDLLVEAIASRPRLVVAGGGHVALAIARQAAALDFAVTIIEDRPEFAGEERFPGATILQGDVPTTLGALPCTWNTFIVIATRGHKLDADCVLQAVTTEARYIGLLGSRRKTVLIEQMLRDEGVPEDRIGVIRAPVGLDLGGRTPAEIALSVMAEITRIRYQGTGAPLSSVSAAGVRVTCL
ncbi:MAG: XdhC family protein [Acidobacteria bacterium]|nr:XdhC family protein [Acidobacteriota bacterium]